MTDALTITQPDDWHLHLRDGDVLACTVKDAAKQFARAIVMPNLVPPIVSAECASGYRERIMSQVPAGHEFEPLMTLYLTDRTQPQDIVAAKQSGVIACKLYPAGATTNSDSGVTDLNNIQAVLETMAEHKMLLLVHGEVTSSNVDIFDREAVFLETILDPLRQRLPQLKIVLEHITTADSVRYVQGAEHNLAATITAHHLLFNRNHMLAGGIRPHYYCLPILKRNSHQQALVAAATSGDARFFIGTDSAPHPRHKKESGCGCAGAYTAFAATELYAEAFEQAGALDKLEGFCSFYGPDYYGLPRNSASITLVKDAWQIPRCLALGDHDVVPVKAGETLSWRIASSV